MTVEHRTAPITPQLTLVPGPNLSTDVRLQWNVPESELDGYRVVWLRHGAHHETRTSSWPLDNWPSEDGPGYQITDLHPGSTYTFSVFRRDENGVWQWEANQDVTDYRTNGATCEFHGP